MAVCQANSETSPAGHRGGAGTADHQPLLPDEAPFAWFAIGFFTSYSHVDIPAHASIAVDRQIGIPLLLADSPRNRLQLSETLALLLEDLGF
jgi:hypothetical protein